MPDGTAKNCSQESRSRDGQQRSTWDGFVPSEQASVATAPEEVDSGSVNDTERSAEAQVNAAEFGRAPFGARNGRQALRP